MHTTQHTRSFSKKKQAFLLLLPLIIITTVNPLPPSIGGDHQASPSSHRGSPPSAPHISSHTQPLSSSHFSPPDASRRRRLHFRCESEINHTLATISSPLRNGIPLRRRHLQVKHLSLLSPTILFVIVTGWFCSSINN